jgi:LexA-binding, inner membrane-associated putative hydrolase
VDPVSHALFARGLNCLDSERRLGRGAVAAFVLGALAPDIDSVLVTRGFDVYLHYHATGTHALLAAPVLAAATAALVRPLVRASRFPRLFTAALIGVVIGHLFFDLVSGSDMRLLAPLSRRSFGPHLLTMADLSAIVVLLAGTLVSWKWRRRGGLLMVAGLAVLLIAKVATRERARTLYEASSSRTPGAVVVDGVPDAVNGSMFRWRFYDRTPDEARAWVVDAWRGTAAIDFVRSAERIDSMSAATLNLSVVRRVLGFAEVPFAWEERAGGERRLLWSDLKYCDPRRCDLSFGAILDEQGAPIRELIQVGTFQQVRDIR